MPKEQSVRMVIELPILGSVEKFGKNNAKANQKIEKIGTKYK